MTDPDDLPYLVPNRSLVEAASWRLASELVRRHPHLRLSQGWVDGLVDDWLVVHAPGGDLVMNRHGRMHLHTPDGGYLHWEHYLTAGAQFDGRDVGPVRFIERLEPRLGLPTPAGTPPSSTPRVLVFRVLAQLAALRALTLAPMLAEDLKDGTWGLGPRPWPAPPLVVFTEHTGQVTRRDGTATVDLPGLYRANGRSITRTVVEMATVLRVPLP
ncbi:hypothetical protein [Georgenia yuyongxinii]|uniref:T3SS peptide-binding chaperone domain-containing protein n=1 Tax=Georgenia yuyongxinii TaxID=2589797 RepID=A0A552WVN7_9MICO|nr:hypothetical protein [Georgenia yuyongxinii]TRW46363.1 hypothetical protein FJ693_05405 [Georgenia yuyongxinii]